MFGELRNGLDAGLAIVIVVLLLICTGLAFGMRSQAHTIAELHTQVGALETERDQFKAAGEQCSQSVDEAKRQADKRAKDVVIARAQVQELTKKLNQSAIDIVAEARPAGLDACTNAERVLNVEIDRATPAPVGLRLNAQSGAGGAEGRSPGAVQGRIDREPSMGLRLRDQGHAAGRQG